MAWNTPNESLERLRAAQRKAQATRRLTVRLSILCAIAGALTIAWLISDSASESRSYPAKSPGAIGTVIPAASRQSPTKETDKELVKEGVKASEDAEGHGLPNGAPMTSAPSSPEVFTKQAFSNASDQILAMIPMGDGRRESAPIPMSRNFEKEFLESLKTPITINSDDDEQTRAAKERVIALREELKQMVDSGMSVAEIVKEQQKIQAENVKIRTDALRELRALIDAGDIEGARAYKFKVNLALQQMGIAEMTMPVTAEERAQRTAERRERLQKRREAHALLEAEHQGKIQVKE